MVIRVYFESSAHAEMVAVFDSESTYTRCLPALEKMAKGARMVVTEGITECCDMVKVEEAITEAEDAAAAAWRKNMTLLQDINK